MSQHKKQRSANSIADAIDPKAFERVYKVQGLFQARKMTLEAANMNAMAQIPTIPPAVEAYFARVPEPARTVLFQLRAIIRAAAPPEATEALSYAMVAFKYKGTLVCYGAFTHHVSLFPMGSAAIQQFAQELKDYVTSKGTIRFPLDKPLPAELIQKIIKARVAMNDKKSK